jgi:hypothetical protein
MAESVSRCAGIMPTFVFPVSLELPGRAKRVDEGDLERSCP